MQEEEELIHPSIEDVVIDAIESSLRNTAPVQVSQSFARVRLKLIHFTKLDRVGWACLGAGRFHAILQAIITKGAFMGHVIAQFITGNYSKWAGDYTITAAIANILLDIDRIELCANDGSRGACFQAGRVGTVFAHVALH